MAAAHAVDRAHRACKQLGMRRNRALLVLGVAIFLAAWVAWKVLHTASTVLPPVPPAPRNAP